MPHQSNDRGSFVLDKRLRGWGRLKKATGTRDERMFGLYVGMVEALHACGRKDWLDALGSGLLSFPRAWDLYRPTDGRSLAVNQLPTPATVRPLWEPGATADDADTGAVADWLDDVDVSRSTRANYTRDLRWLRRLAKPTAAVADVPALIKAARKETLKRTPQPRRAFNCLRTTAQAFLHATLTQRHPIYQALADVPVLEEHRRPTSGLTPADAWAVHVALADANAGVAACWWTLCCTGMRPAEYWQEDAASWRAEPDRLVVFASKTSASRLVPRLDPAGTAGPPPAGRTTVRDHLRELSRGLAAYRGRGPWTRHVTMYDGRRSFRHWCEMAGVPDSRATVYRGRTLGSVDERYKQHTITAEYLAEDTAKLRAYIGLTDDAAGLRLVKET